MKGGIPPSQLCFKESPGTRNGRISHIEPNHLQPRTSSRARATNPANPTVMILPQVHLRNGFGWWFLPLVSQRARLYLKQSVRSTHFHLVCERSPYLGARRRGFAADCPLYHPHRLLLYPTILLVGPARVSTTRAVRWALGGPRQFESVAPRPEAQNLHAMPVCLESSRSTRMGAAKASVCVPRRHHYRQLTLLRLLLPLNDRV